MSKIKMLLVATYEAPPRSFIKPQLGLMYIKKFLEILNVDASVSIIDPQISGVSKAKQEIERGWDVIGFYTTHPTLINSVNLMIHAYDYYNQQDTKQPILLGGGPGAYFKNLFQISPLDIVVHSEAELFMEAFLNSVIQHNLQSPIKDSDLAHLENLPGDYQIRSFSEEGHASFYNHKALRAHSRIGSDMIDELIQPVEWELEMHEPYVEWTREMLNHKYDYPIYATRGCSSPGCLYCSSFRSVDSRNGTRAPSPIKLVQAFVKICGSSLNPDSFVLMDDTFVWDRGWMIEVCLEVIRAKKDGELPHNISFVVKSRVDQFDEELVRLMAIAGFRHINVGVESGSPNVLAEMAKVRDTASYLKHTREIMSWIPKYGISVHAYTIFFSPTSTITDLLETISLCLEITEAGGEISNYPGIMAFPGSPYEMFWERGKIKLEQTVIDNPLYNVSRDRVSERDGFFIHAQFNEIPLKVELPEYVVPTDEDMYAVWKKSLAIYQSAWEHFSEKYDWKASTSARSGLVRLYTYLTSIRELIDVDGETDQKIQSFMEKIFTLLPMQNAETCDIEPESQSCTDSNLYSNEQLAFLTSMASFSQGETQLQLTVTDSKRGHNHGLQTHT